jgi:hypothetical protein
VRNCHVVIANPVAPSWHAGHLRSKKSVLFAPYSCLQSFSNDPDVGIVVSAGQGRLTNELLIVAVDVSDFGIRCSHQFLRALNCIPKPFLLFRVFCNKHLGFPRRRIGCDVRDCGTWNDSFGGCTVSLLLRALRKRSCSDSRYSVSLSGLGKDLRGIIVHFREGKKGKPTAVIGFAALAFAGPCVKIETGPVPRIGNDLMIRR